MPQDHIRRRPSSRERFLTALRGGEPDYVPLFDFLDSQPLYEAVLGRRPSAYNACDTVELSLELGMDAVFVPFGGFKGYTAEIQTRDESGVYTDEWGTTYKNTGASWPAAAPIAYPVKGPVDLNRLRVPDPTLPTRLDGIREAHAAGRGDVAIVGGINGPLTVAFTLAGWETFMLALHEAPTFVDDLLLVGAEYYTEACHRMIDAGVDAICVAEDMGFASGLFMSPVQFRRHLFPLVGNLIQLIKGHDVPVLLHCDGNINLILDELVSMGIDGYNPVERKSHMDIFTLKEKYGNRLCLVGNVDSTGTLTSGTPEEVRAEVLELIKRVAPGGAYVLASDSDLRNEMPLANMLAMIETAEAHGRYPVSASGSQE